MKATKIDPKYEAYFNTQIESIKKRDKYIQSQRNKKEEKLKKNLTFHPTITEKGKTCREYGYKFRFKWKNRVTDHIKSERKKKEKKFLEEIKPFTLNERTKKIIEKQKKDGKYIHPVDDWKKRYEQFKKEKDSRESKKVNETFKPKLSTRSKSLAKSRTGNVYKRLLEDGERSKIRRECIIENTRMSGQPQLIPTKIRSSIRRNSDVFSELYQQAQSQKERKERRIREVEENTYFSPLLSKKSIRIASRSKTRKPLYISPSVKRTTRRTSEPFISPRKRKIPKRSKKRIQNYFDSFHRRNVKFLLKKEGQIDRKKEKKEIMDEKECTFQPKMSKGTKKIFKKKIHRFDDGTKKSKEKYLKSVSKSKMLLDSINNRRENERELSYRRELEESLEKLRSYNSDEEEGEKEEYYRDESEGEETLKEVYNDNKSEDEDFSSENTEEVINDVIDDDDDDSDNENDLSNIEMKINKAFEDWNALNASIKFK